MGFGCLVLFALPFAAVGLVSGVMVVSKLAVGDWRTAAFLGLFAVLFGGAGMGLIAVAWAGRREAADDMSYRPGIRTSLGSGDRIGRWAGSLMLVERGNTRFGPLPHSGI
jgi:hypothetical protein